jgi:tetratricopeptide (TPR) repeat protein
MALKYWGWEGKHDDIAAVIKPGVDDEEKDFIERGKTDKNVMPSEMLDFVNENTAYRALSRFGGDEDLVKRLIAAGFPVLIEKAYYEEDYTGKIAWMGHYLFVTGYDDAKAAFTVQDAYLKTGKNGTGQDLLSDYPTFLEGWRSFNYLFMVVYPPEQEAQVLSLLGSWADEPWANQHALDLADQEIQHNTGNDLFFAWFNKGTSHVQLGQYPEAAGAFDRAFQIYAGLGSDDKQRPYRIMWYQTWPYWAYFYTGRYQDVINLADTTLNETIDKPTLEESLYWRGMGEWALGNVSAAIADFQQSVYYNPHFTAGLVQLQELGAAP